MIKIFIIYSDKSILYEAIDECYDILSIIKLVLVVLHVSVIPPSKIFSLTGSHNHIHDIADIFIMLIV